MLPLNKKVFNKLRKKKLTIAVAESFTGGLLSASIISIPKASEIYKFGLITYSNESKSKLLKIPNKILAKNGAVSRKTCIYMVKNLSGISKADVCISTTGIAGPSGGKVNKPVGLVYIGIKFKRKILCKKLLIQKKQRNHIQKETVKRTLKFLNNYLK